MEIDTPLELELPKARPYQVTNGDKSIMNTIQ